MRSRPDVEHETILRPEPRDDLCMIHELIADRAAREQKLTFGNDK